MTISKKRILTCIAAASIPLFFACSDDKPTSPSGGDDPVVSSAAALPESAAGQPEATSSSAEGSETITPESSAGPVVESSSATEVVPESSSALFREPTEEEIAQERIFTAASATNEFRDLPTVYKELDPTDKVAFVIRHAQREKSTGVESQLTEKGIEQSKTLGTYLVSEEPFSYGSTGFVRTRATAQYISEGRGQEFPEPIVLPELVASTYIASQEKFDELKSAAGYDDEAFMYSRWSIDGDFTEAFNDFEKTGVQIITQAILPRMSTENRVNIFISHDMFIGPLVAYCTNREMKILRKHAKASEGCTNCTWISYLQGIAIIVKADGTRKYIPVSGNMMK
ncbi:histidine phosphatase family protein [uncultured Fibrobacter sp.]|uniref:histidine phosphatase family protein n=1 Tax=uncultured Fibrobacter sp. TaxID=261512 RepID=UPI0025CD8B3D|nr:histidine phosphatase family protein [uncultured Fibrobacter sp.]